MNQITRDLVGAAALSVHLVRVSMNWSLALAYLPVVLLTRRGPEKHGA